MNTGSESKPWIKRPHSSLVVGFIGPNKPPQPSPAAHCSTAANSRRLASASFTHSKKPKNASRRPASLQWDSSKMPAIRPTSRPFREAIQSRIRACSNKGLASVNTFFRSISSGATQCGSPS